MYTVRTLGFSVTAQGRARQVSRDRRLSLLEAAKMRLTAVPDNMGGAFMVNGRSVRSATNIPDLGIYPMKR